MSKDLNKVRKSPANIYEKSIQSSENSKCRSLEAKAWHIWYDLRNSEDAGIPESE